MVLVLVRLGLRPPRTTRRLVLGLLVLSLLLLGFRLLFLGLVVAVLTEGVVFGGEGVLVVRSEGAVVRTFLRVVLLIVAVKIRAEVRVIEVKARRQRLVVAFLVARQADL